MPDADFCSAVRLPFGSLSRTGDAEQISWGKLSRLPCTIAESTLRTLMEVDFAVRCPLVRCWRLVHSVFVHRLARLLHASFGPHLAAVALASSLGLHLHQVGQRTFTSKLLSMPSTQRSRPCGGRYACVQVGRGVLIRILSGHKEVPYDPSTPNDAGRNSSVAITLRAPSVATCVLSLVSPVYFRRSPDQLRPPHIREYQAYLFRERKLDPSSVTQKLAALRFFFIKTLKKPWSVAETPYPKQVRRLPTILSQEEVARLINSARNPFDRVLLMTLYATGARCAPRWRDCKSAISTASAWSSTSAAARAGKIAM